MRANTLRLDGPATTLVFAWDDGIPEVIYHGDRLQDDVDLEMVVRARVRPLPHATLDVNPPVSLHPESGTGFPGHPALIASRSPEGNAAWAGRFAFVCHERISNGVRFALSDANRGLELSIELTLDPDTDVLESRSALVNTGDTALSIDWLAAPVLAPAQHFSEHFSFQGRWCGEFDMERLPTPIGQTIKENRRGRTSHESFPGTILLAPATGEESGPCLGVHFGWSGNHRLMIERQSCGDVQLQMGVLLFPGEGDLPPGETMVTPKLYVAHSSNGLNDLSHKLHAHIRRNILKISSDKPRPVTVNTWEALYFDHTVERLLPLVDAAAEIGAERFVLDDGWFKGRNDDTSSLGDWYADETKYPQGLQPVADYIRNKGMEFGLWVEPEMINPTSDLFRAHPDWVLGVEGYPMITGRNQLVLNIARPEVSDYLYERLSSLVGKHDIAYLKWDMNRDLVLPGDGSGKAVAYWQTSALYALLDRLRDEFPNLEIESCASGGGRVDYEILKRTDRFWTSDSNDSVERMRIQTGFSYFFPPEVMGAHVGPAWSHTSGRGLHAGFRALVASYGHMGIEADLTRMNTDDLLIMKKAVERHKQDRTIWHSGSFSRVRTVDPGLLGALAVSENKKAARLVMTQLDRPRSTVPPSIFLSQLDPETLYLVEAQAISEQVSKANRDSSHPLLANGLHMTGKAIALVGIALPALYAQTAIAIEINAVENKKS